MTMFLRRPDFCWLPRILRLRTMGRPASMRTDSCWVNWVSCLCFTRPARNRPFLLRPAGGGGGGGGAVARPVPGACCGGGVAVVAGADGADPAFSLTFMGLYPLDFAAAMASLALFASISVLMRLPLASIASTVKVGIQP